MDYIRLILSLAFSISLMYLTLECDIKAKKTQWILGIYTSVIIACNILALALLGYTHYMKYVPLLIQFPVLIAFIFISKFQPIKVFFMNTTLVGVCTSYSAIGVVVAHFFNNSRMVVNLVSYVLYFSSWYLLYKYIRPILIDIMKNTDTKGWLGFCMIPLSYAALIYSSAQYNLDNLHIESMFKTVILFLVMAVSAYYMIIRLFQETRKKFDLQTEQNLMAIQVNAAKFHFEALEESHKETLIHRHDMRHHLALINSYLIDDNKEGAQKYIAEVQKTIDDAVIEKYCSNYTVNLILYAYISHAKEERIVVETHMDLEESPVISDMDLCVVFSNIIENAINACKCIPYKEKRFIKIKCGHKGEKLLIQVTNSCIEDVQFIDNMPIRDGSGQGLGTKSIVAVTQKYKGLYSFTAKEGVFTTCVMI